MNGPVGQTQSVIQHDFIVSVSMTLSNLPQNRARYRARARVPSTKRNLALDPWRTESFSSVFSAKKGIEHEHDNEHVVRAREITDPNYRKVTDQRSRQPRSNIR
jgi:hypothetical protein